MTTAARPGPEARDRSSSAERTPVGDATERSYQSGRYLLQRGTHLGTCPGEDRYKTWPIVDQSSPAWAPRRTKIEPPW
ncbi:hypothetical protein NDU88_001294 [Pleurodeles waltl]|uniref:Uncharacterized protein n=1 Tax=Pleurodeles waltl TaxID=8319 RepID=A0AAV7RB74_PLEWA|nr:hypothetical protein NDU88_001294 [Pleurodeles waltl]